MQSYMIAADLDTSEPSSELNYITTVEVTGLNTISWDLYVWSPQSPGLFKRWGVKEYGCGSTTRMQLLRVWTCKCSGAIWETVCVCTNIFVASFICMLFGTICGASVSHNECKHLSSSEKRKSLNSKCLPCLTKPFSNSTCLLTKELLVSKMYPQCFFQLHCSISPSPEACPTVKNSESRCDCHRLRLNCM